MKDTTLYLLRFITQWSTLLLSVVFRGQFSGGVAVRSIGGIMIGLGLSLWILSKVALGQFFTSSLSPRGFVTKGPYSKLRHPMYTGGLLLFAGIGILLESAIGLALTGLLILPLLVYSAVEEERHMVEQFGEEYIGYKKTTAF